MTSLADVTAVTSGARRQGPAVSGPGRAGPSALMEDEDCPDLVPIGAEQNDGSPGGKIPVTIITGYLGERGAGAAHGGDCREGPGGLRGCGAGAAPHGPGEQLRPLQGISRAAPSSTWCWFYPPAFSVQVRIERRLFAS